MTEMQKFIEDLAYRFNISTDLMGDMVTITGEESELQRIKTELDDKGFICDNLMFSKMPDSIGSLWVCFYGNDSDSNGYMIMSANTDEANDTKNNINNVVMNILFGAA